MLRSPTSTRVSSEPLLSTTQLSLSNSSSPTIVSRRLMAIAIDGGRPIAAQGPILWCGVGRFDHVECGWLPLWCFTSHHRKNEHILYSCRRWGILTANGHFKDHCRRISSQDDNKRYCSRGFDQRWVWVAAAQSFRHLINTINTSWGSKQN